MLQEARARRVGGDMDPVDMERHRWVVMEDLLIPRAPVVPSFRRWDWGGCQEGPVIPSEEVLGGLGDILCASR